MDWFTDVSVNPGAVRRFFAASEHNGFEVHTLQIYKGDRQLVRAAQAPYACDDPREIYSLSKMFCATVVGIAVDQGYLTVQDRVAEIFGKTNVSDKFSRLTVEHVLSMNTGHDRCVIRDMAEAENAVDAFFSVEPVYEPGTHFTYNSGATCLLCAIVEKVTGRNFFAYACENLFYPLDILDASWKRCPNGTCLGGAGLYVSSDDIVKLGRMYADKGLWQGKRILSEAWIDRASSAVSDNSGSGGPDWTSGYGYQIWRNARDGYRGDGAFGQLCLVLPKHDCVVAIQGCGGDMQKEMEDIFDLLDHLQAPAEPVSPCSFQPPEAKEPLPVLDRMYRMAENPAGLTMLRLRSDGDRLELTFADREKLQTLAAGRNRWEYSVYRGGNLTPSLLQSPRACIPEETRVSAACRMEDGNPVLTLRYRTSPHTESMRLSITGNRLKITFEVPGGKGLRPDWMGEFTGIQV